MSATIRQTASQKGSQKGSPKNSQTTSQKICAAALELLDQSNDSASASMRRIADKVGITPMALYRHFPNREALLRAATEIEYQRIADYFKVSSARKDATGLRVMRGYLDYALDHPNLFRYIYFSQRADVLAYPDAVRQGKSPSLKMLRDSVSGVMQEGKLRADDVTETSLTIWAHAHGLVTLYLSGRILLSRRKFTQLFLRSMDRLLHGLC
jgi:AcrR family transcriptional regulator